MATDLSNLLETLIASRVEFVLVGGLAAVLHGAPTATFDVDIVPRRSRENSDRLATLLGSLNARYRGHPNRSLRPTSSALLGPGHQLLMTDLGPLDVLGEIEGGLDYEVLLAHVVPIDLGGAWVQVLGLEKLIEIKRALGRPKDLASLEVLEATLQRTRGE